jgi:hypothetical protein
MLYQRVNFDLAGIKAARKTTKKKKYITQHYYARALPGGSSYE